MLFIENVTINGREFTHTWSDSHTIIRDGVEYDEAYDPIGSDRVYDETNTLKEMVCDEVTGDEFLDMLEEVL